MAEPRRILERSLTSRYFTLEGLERLTGANPRDFDEQIIKELVDNSLDACDELEITPRITIQANMSDDLVTYAVADNACGIDEKSIAKITDLTAISSSRYLYKHPSRGALGHFWKYLLGMSYAFYSSSNMKTIEPPIHILTHGKRYEFRVVNEQGVYNVITRTADTELTPGTRVSITIPLFNENWLKLNRLISLIGKIAYCNPHAEFTLDYNNTTILWYPNEEDCVGPRRMRESPHWFSLDEMRERIESETYTKPLKPINDFINMFRGLSGSSRLTEEISIETLARQSEAIEKLYNKMRNETKPPSPSVLTPIGEKALLRRAVQVDNIDSQSPHRYVAKKATYNHLFGGKVISVPFIVEALTILTDNHHRRLVIALNRSPKLDDPFGRYDFILKGDKHVSGLAGILTENGIDTYEPRNNNY